MFENFNKSLEIFECFFVVGMFELLSFYKVIEKSKIFKFVKSSSKPFIALVGLVFFFLVMVAFELKNSHFRVGCQAVKTFFMIGEVLEIQIPDQNKGTKYQLMLKYTNTPDQA